MYRNFLEDMYESTHRMNLPSGGIDNILFLTDSYKVTHHLQYPPKTTKVYSYFESRGGKFDEIVFFGLQYILKRWLVGTVVTEDMIKEAQEVFQKHFGSDLFHAEGWRHIVKEHGGKLPLLVKAVPEGTVVPVKNVLFTVENTCEECYWLTNYFETVFVQVWYPMTVATNSREQKRILAKYLIKTADNIDGLPFKLHDFGYRGASSIESAGIGGASHLVNFMGTDTVAGLLTARKFYDCDIAGFSIPAAEHSTITTWGREGEKDAFKNMLEKFPTGLVAVVSDSYNIWNACEQYWGKDLKEMVSNRKGTLVVRPDSGEPQEVVVKVLNILEKAFTCSTTKNGYKLLPSYVRMIQGDGVSYETLGKILEHMKVNKWSSDNLAFGSGGALLQKLDRDTQKCAFKCSYAIVDGKMVNVFKEPVTDAGKNSKRGYLSLHKEGDKFVTKQNQKGRVSDSTGDCTAQFFVVDKTDSEDLLEVVFENGELKNPCTFDEVRKRAEIPEVKNYKST